MSSEYLESNDYAETEIDKAFFSLRGIAMTEQRPIPMAEAAIRLKLSWSQTWNLLLKGDLIGEKKGGRWHLTTKSVEQYRDERDT